MVYQAVHASPGDVALATAAQCVSPHPGHFSPELHEACPVSGYAKVAAMPSHHGFQVLTLFGDGSVHALSHFQLERLKFPSQTLGTGQPRDLELALFAYPAAMREAQEVKGLRLASSFSPAAYVASGVAPELDQPRPVWMQREAKGFESLGYLCLERLRVTNVLEACYPVIGTGSVEAPSWPVHDDDIPCGMALSPLPCPQVKRVLQLDVGQKGADVPALYRACFALRQPALFQHARVQPLLDQADDARVGHAVFDEFDQPLVFDGVEEFADVCIEYEVHSLAPDSHRYSVQRVVCAALGSKSVAEAQEVLLVDGVQYFGGGALDDFVFQCGYATEAKPTYGRAPFCAVGFCDVNTLYGLRSVVSSGYAVGQVMQVALQVLSVLLPRHTIYAGGCVSLDSEIGSLQALDGVDVMQQSGELRVASAFGRLSYAVKRTSHVVSPHRSAGHARCNRISLGLWPSLHGLRRRRACTRSFVRPLLRYFAAVRLPVSLAHRCTPIGFSMRSVLVASQQTTEDDGISRFPNSVFVCVHRVSDRVESKATSPKRLPRCGLRHSPTASAPQSTRTSRHGACISRLNGWPALPPVNASPTPSRMCTHDSESS